MFRRKVKTLINMILINDKISSECTSLFGTVIEENYGDEVSVTVIATGIE